ncbi:MAG: hypothetical protein GTO54_07025 [Nitrososphaeria archaeon]|nr:hypothetical protein [Nitrososphaeria archaeon]
MFYRIKATEVYYFTVEANSEDEAIDKAGECDYSGTKNTYGGMDVEITRSSKEQEEDDIVLEPDYIGR